MPIRRRWSIANAAKDAYDFLGTPEGELAIAAGRDLCRDRAEIERRLHGLSARRMRTAKEARLAAAAEAHPQRADQADEGAKATARATNTTTTRRTRSPARTISPKSSAASTFYDPPERGFEREIRKRLEYWAKLRKERGGR